MINKRYEKAMEVTWRISFEQAMHASPSSVLFVLKALRDILKYKKKGKKMLWTLQTNIFFIYYLNTVFKAVFFIFIRFSEEKKTTVLQNIKY
jgi:glycopeptide antibiotics resistance protein